MSHNHDHTDDIDLSILEQMGYEERDLKIEKTAKLGIGGGVCIVLTMLVAWGVIKLMEPSLSWKPEKDTQFRTLPGKDFPLLQSNATAHGDMVKLRSEEHERIEGYGWTDESRKTAHIPLDRAMDLVLEEGLPVKAGARKMKKPAPEPVMPIPADMHEEAPATGHEEEGSTFPDIPEDHTATRLPGAGAEHESSAAATGAESSVPPSNTGGGH